jgi:hypothetical protein
MLGRVTVEDNYWDIISKSFVNFEELRQWPMREKELRNVLGLVQIFQPVRDWVVTKASSIEHGLIKKMFRGFVRQDAG